MHWDKQLAYRISPKSGPLRAMETLLDANHALSHDLPPGALSRDHWRAAGWRVVNAARTGDHLEVVMATELIVTALVYEGWMTAGMVGRR